MRSYRPRLVHLLLTTLFLGCGSLSLWAGQHQANDVSEFAYSSFVLHNPVPLGLEAFRLPHSKQTFQIFASVENSRLDGVKVSHVPKLRGSVLLADGTPMSHYPPVLDFRVTASAMSDGPVIDPDDVRQPCDLSELLAGLQFQLKVYRALDMQILKPTVTRQIGVPPDLPFKERVYQVVFDLQKIPVDARCVLEVFSPKGERLTRFHFELL